MNIKLLKKFAYRIFFDHHGRTSNVNKQVQDGFGLEMLVVKW